MVGRTESRDFHPARIEQLSDSLLRGPRRREATIEDVALILVSGDDHAGLHGNAGDRIGKTDAPERGTDEPQPCRRIRRGTRGPERMFGRGSVGERETQREIPHCLSTRPERLTHLADEPVDHEEQPLDVTQCVVRPRARGPRPRPGECTEWTPLVLSASEPPQTDAIRREPDFHFLLAKPGERAACLDPDARQQREHARAAE